MQTSDVRSSRPVWLGLAVALAFGIAVVLFAPSPAQACMQDICCSGCSFCDFDTICCEECHFCTVLDALTGAAKPMGHIGVSFPEPDRALISIYGYATTAITSQTACVTALSPVTGIEKVNAIDNYDTRTGRPFEEVSFFSSATPGFAVPEVIQKLGLIEDVGRPWYGFQSQITGSIAEGTPNHFVIDVTLERGISHEEFLEHLRQEGMFVTSSSDPDGIPNEGHQFFRRLGDSRIVVEDNPAVAGRPLGPQIQIEK